MEENCVCVNVYWSIMYRYLRTKVDTKGWMMMCVYVFVCVCT